MKKRLHYSRRVHAHNEYRRVLYTTPQHLQVVSMTLKPGEDIPMEVHLGSEQSLYVIDGTLSMGTMQRWQRGDVVIVPKGVRHYVRNPSKSTLLKLLVHYSRPEHPPTRRQKRQPK